MLKYKIKKSDYSEYAEIEYNNLYLSPDGNFISGTTDIKYHLIDKQNILLSINDNYGKEYPININNFTYQGYVKFPQVFTLEKTLLSINDNNVELYGFRYIDGKYYYEEYDEEYQPLGYFTNIDSTNYYAVNDDKYYYINKTDETVTILTYYYVKNGIININDKIVETFFYEKDDNNNEVKYFVFDNNNVKTKYYILNYTKNYWKEITEFRINKEPNIMIDYDYISCTKQYPYIIYALDKYFLNYNASTNNYEVLIDNKLYVKNGEYAYFNDGINTHNLKIYYEWRNVEKGNYLNIYVNNNNYQISEGNEIIINSRNKQLFKYNEINDNDSNYFLINGEQYYKSNENDTIDIINYENQDYIITYTDYNWNLPTEYKENDPVLKGKDIKYGYIIVNDETILLIIDSLLHEAYVKTNNFKIRDTDKYHLYEVKSYQYIIFNNDKIPVKKYAQDFYLTNDNNEREFKQIYTNYVEIEHNECYHFIVDEVTSDNAIRCHISSLFNSEGILYNIIKNIDNYNIFLVNDLFNYRNLDKNYFLYNNLEGRDDIYKLYNPLLSFNLPLILYNDSAMNLHQEDILEKQFVEEEISKSINPIVDMDKDIYYPVYKDNLGQFQPISEIKFYLHFRTRNKDNWSINDTDTNNSNWNIFDYYPNKLTDVSNFYYQPSDLLYFLDFDNYDIFYQKDKIKRSFIRLLYYDTYDIATQSLLHTSTIYLDEEKLYNTYINNRLYPHTYMNIDPIDNDIKDVIYKYIDVQYEPINNKIGNKPYTFDESHRLSSEITVKENGNSTKSSEGFYLYLFKEYTTKKHERTIYLKIEFNHAGKGKKINFLYPYTEDVNGNKRVLNLSVNSQDYNELKQGYSLSEIYKRMFIEIKVIYDEQLNRYVYYFPDWLNQKNDELNIMKFNLYELKIKDES